MSPLSCGHHSQSTSRCIADDTHRYRVCMSVGACMPLLENGMMMRVKKKKHTATGQFKLSTVVVQKKKNYIHSHTTKQRKLSQYKHRLNELSALYHYTRAALCTHTNALTHTQHPSHNTLELPSKRKNVSGSVALNIISIKIV